MFFNLLFGGDTMKCNNFFNQVGWFLLVFLWSLFLVPSHGIVYVDQTASDPTPDGSSWEEAMPFIQSGIDASSPGEEIWVADGVYPEDLTFGEGDVVYGGFEGLGGAEETQRNQRNWEKNVTEINASTADSGNPSRHVAVFDGATTCTLDGFTLWGGMADWSYPHDMGGGILFRNTNGSNTIANCIIKDNYAMLGGAIACENASPTFRNCVIINNQAEDFGGGVYCIDSSHPVFSGCIIRGNLSLDEGGGVYTENAAVDLINCAVSGNTAVNTGGAAYLLGAGNMSITNCAFSNNSAPLAGGLYLVDQLNPSISNTIFHQNSGYAVYSVVSIYYPKVQYCLFYDNPDGALWHLSGSFTDDQVDDINNYFPVAEMNITGDPNFVDGAGGDLHINPCSAAVDVGTSVSAPSVDLDGNPRPINIPGMGNDGSGHEYDIGAYEAQFGLEIAVSPREVLFGEQTVNQGAKNKSVYLANIRTQPIQISNISLSGSSDFSFVFPPSLNDLAYCENREIQIEFDPSAKRIITGTLTVESSDTNNPSIQVLLEGKGTNMRPWAGQIPTGAAFDFRNYQDRVVIPGYNNFPTTEITASFWMKSEETEASDGILSYAVPDSNNEFLIINQANLTIYVCGRTVSTGVAVNDGEWHHVAVTWRSSDGLLKLYVDFKKRYSGTLSSGDTLAGGGTFVFAEDQDSVGGGYSITQAYIGLLDEVSFWNVEKIDSDILLMMHIEAAGTESGLVGYWNFNEAKGQQVLDHSGNGNHGAIQGDPGWIIPSTAPIVDQYAIVGANIDRDTVFILNGFDGDGDAMFAMISELPSSGQLYQYDNGIRGDPITQTITIVTDPQSRVIYDPPDHSKLKDSPNTLNYYLSDSLIQSLTAVLEWQYSDREIRVTGGGYDFGLGLVGEPPGTLWPITVHNDGTTTLTFYGAEVEFVGTNPGDFNIDSDTGQSQLAGGESRVIDIVFTPQSKGNKEAYLRIISDDLDEQITDIFFEGFGDTRPKAGFARSGTALNFTKTSDRVIIPKIDGFTTHSLTVECWLKGDSDGGVLSYAATNKYNNEFLLYNTSEGFSVYVGNAPKSNEVSISPDEWYHIAVTWQAIDGLYNLYKDGILETTGTLVAGRSFLSGGTLVFAEDQDSVGGGFDWTQAYLGKIDDVRMWNTVRTQQEIKDNMLDELKGDEPGLVGYWKLDEGTGLKTYDATPNNKSGTLSGAPTWILSSAMGFEADITAFASGDHDTTITLMGVDADWDILTAFITEVPDSQTGEIYQLAAPGPVRGAQITAIDTEVTDSQMRIVYAPAPLIETYSAVLGWKVNDDSVDSDNPAQLTILVNLDKKFIDYLLGKSTLTPEEKDMLDFNQDGILDIADLVSYYSN